MMATGRDRLITILRLGRSFDSHNRPVEGWSKLAQVWAAKMDVSDGERFRAAQVAATVTTRFRLLWSPQVADVNPKDRIALDGREYDIVGVKEIGRREGLEVTAAARVDLST